MFLNIDDIIPARVGCLFVVLRAGRVPFVDFGVWNVYRHRLAKFQDIDAQVIVGGQVVSKCIVAPASLEGWLG